MVVSGRGNGELGGSWQRQNQAGMAFVAPKECPVLSSVLPSFPSLFVTRSWMGECHKASHQTRAMSDADVTVVSLLLVLVLVLV